MFSSEDEGLLAGPLPHPRTVAVSLPAYPGAAGLIEYREAGAPHRPAILLMHGIGSSSAGYVAQLAGLQDRYRLIAWNAPGFGRSTAFAEPRPGSNTYVAAALALLHELGVTQLAGLVGSSWGSVVACAFAAAGFRIGALVLSAPNTARGVQRTADERERARQAAVDAGLASFALARGAIADRLLAPHAAAPVREHTMRLRDDVTQQGWAQAMSMLFTIHTPQILPNVAAPVTMIFGSEDKVAPEAAHAAVLRAARPDATLLRFQGVGHMPKLEAPASFNRAVQASVCAAWAQGIAHHSR